MFKDLFSGGASDYSKFRPTYPAELFEYLAKLAPSPSLAWDCGTGNGQAAVLLSKFFSKVIATDPSAKQIAQAVQNSKITYEVGVAERSELKSESTDLITVAQAFHWFRHRDFFLEARRVLKPNGILAVWCYELAQISPNVDATVLRLYKDVLAAYWEPERHHVETGYKNILFEMHELQAPQFFMTAEWSFEQLAGYLKTWSAAKKFSEKNPGRDAVAEAIPALKDSWGSVEKYKVTWPIALRIGKNN